VWAYDGGRGPAVPRCRRFGGARLDRGWAACPAFTPALDCAPCGACCREAFDVVEMGVRDGFVRRYPEMVVWVEGRATLPRGADGRCPLLVPRDGGTGCGRYEGRPKTCREFEMGSGNCVEARRRVGLTP
jgi:Fe-S-cluster containining protein